jgi:flagellar hook-associated protein 1 FlgK
MGLGAALEIGKNGLTIYRVATEVTGENIANVNTPGYSRQRLILETAPPTSANNFPLGSGVKIAAVERYYDGLLQQQIVNAQTTQGYDTTRSTVLQQIEPSFNEVANDGLGTAVANYFSAWQDLSLNPGGSAERQVVITRAQILADNFHSVSTTLADSVSMQNASLVPLTDSINSALKNIAQLNGQIKTTEVVSGNANETRDQRDQLVRDLASKIGITFSENSDGTTDLKFADSGAALVTGSTFGTFSLDKSNPGSFVVQLAAAGGALSVVTPVSGQLGATVALRNTIIPGYIAKIDTLAASIVSSVNARHIGGYSPTGATSQLFFNSSNTKAGNLMNGSNVVTNVDVTGLKVGMKAQGTGIPAGAVIGAIDPTAHSFTLVDSTGTAVYATTTAPGSTLAFPEASAAAFFSINATLDISTIAASGNPLLPGDNSNALAIAQLVNSSTVPSGTISATYSSFYSSLVSSVGVDVQSSKTTVAQDEAFSKQLSTLRESNSGVSLDEELTNLIKYQRSYQASAKLITTATDMMDIVLGIIR